MPAQKKNWNPQTFYEIFEYFNLWLLSAAMLE